MPSVKEWDFEPVEWKTAQAVKKKLPSSSKEKGVIKGLCTV